MTDNEIIKALESCSINDCQHCPILTRCNYVPSGLLPMSTLGLLNRQKAEIERLYRIIAVKDYSFAEVTAALRLAKELLETEKSEAIKEFAQRLKGKIWYRPECQHVGSITPDYIDNLVKEITKGANDNGR